MDIGRRDPATTKVQPFPFSQILENMAAIREWLRSAGIPNLGRLAAHERNVNEIFAHSAKGTHSAFRETLSPSREREILWGIVELDELVASLVPLIRAGTPALAEKAAWIVNGPADLALENANSNRARNTMFEIALAARIAEAGLVPILGEAPDLAIAHGGDTVLFQCKRPLFGHKLDRNLSSAKKQLERDCASFDPTNVEAVIAICLSRMINNGTQLHTFDTLGDAEVQMEQWIHDVVKRCDQWASHAPSREAIAVLVRLRVPVFVATNGYTVLSRGAILTSPSNSRLPKILENLQFG